MQPKEEEIKELLCAAIKQRHLVKFYYESNSSKKKEWRTVRPYLIGIKENGSIFLAGLPITELPKKIEKRITGHYLLRKIDIMKLEVLSETFSDPGVPKKRVIDTPTVKVICRFIYEDEDIEDVKKA